MNDDRSRSFLLVPPSTRDLMQGLLSANVALAMYKALPDLWLKLSKSY